jgi:hypothetical protein
MGLKLSCCAQARSAAKTVVLHDNEKFRFKFLPVLEGHLGIFLYDSKGLITCRFGSLSQFLSFSSPATLSSPPSLRSLPWRYSIISKDYFIYIFGGANFFFHDVLYFFLCFVENHGFLKVCA